MAAPRAGYFYERGVSDDIKIKDRGMMIEFSGSAVSGRGENERGSFTLQGSYDAATRKLVLRKRCYDDDAEEHASE